ncbi:hypothetical protein EII17_00120 [Clostridiales bacterium COT073_COT-073]|nr:hypothetical protein EII17_00120 [Clostridiales bacterium COT073_COT-073]
MKRKKGFWRALIEVIWVYKSLLGFGLVFTLLGGGLIESGIMDYDGSDLKGLLVGLIFGALLLLPGGGALVMIILTVLDEKEEAVDGEEVELVTEEHALTKPLTQFREILNRFFENSRIVQNEEIQGFVTQLYFQILNLQKKRLLKKGITLTLKTKQKMHGGYHSNIPIIRERSYDDGKYRIGLVREQISGEKTFWRNGKKLWHKKTEQLADYTLLTAFQQGQDKVVCPSCGNTTTRENLLDGCDFCRTKFTVEDLGERIQNFSFGTDYQVQYAKYRQIRNTVLKWGTMLGGIPGAIYITVIGIKAYFETWQTGEAVGPFVAMLGLLIAAAFFAILSAVVVSAVLWFGLLPAMQLLAGISYINKKKLQESKDQEENNQAVEQAVKKYDPRFSLQGFWGNIHNKLAAIHFAENEKEINAFADCDLSAYLPWYQNVIDLEIDSLRLDQYFVQNQLQYAEVTAVLKLLNSDGKKIKDRKEKIKLYLAKSALCKTQSITGPEVIRCQGCGSSILLLEGKHCHYCGSQIPLFEHDWVITGYQNQ